MKEGIKMDKYMRMKNPPRFDGEWKYFAFFILDILTIVAFLFGARMLNNLFMLSFVAAFFNYILSFIVAVFMIWRPVKNPYQRQFFVIVEAIFFDDKNNYHCIDPNRNYHGKQK